MSEKGKKVMESAAIRVNVDCRDFDAMVDRYMRQDRTYKSAYEQAEREHEKLTGHRRYSDHESYRVARSRRIKKRQK